MMLSYSSFCALSFLLKATNNFGVEAVGCGRVKDGFGLLGMTPAETSELVEAVSAWLIVNNQTAAFFSEYAPSREAFVARVERPVQVSYGRLVPLDIAAIAGPISMDSQEPFLRWRGGSSRYRQNEQRRCEYKASHDDLSILDQNNFGYQTPYLGRQKGQLVKGY